MSDKKKASLLRSARPSLKPSFFVLLNKIFLNDQKLELETSTLTKRDRKQLNIFERKVYRRILGPVYDKGKENWRILNNKEIYANIKKPTVTETIRLHRLRWFEHVQRMEENRIPKRVLYMNWETIRPRGRPRNRWLDEVREDGRMVGGEEWQEKV